MRLTPIPFASDTAQPQSGFTSLELLQNLYPEPNPNGAKGQLTLYGTPGLTLFSTIGGGTVRGMRKMGSRLFAVVGDYLYIISNSGAARQIGHIGGSGDVAIDTNGIHLGIATSGPLYAANETQVLELPFGGMNGVTYQDGYTIYTDSQQFWISGLDDMTTIDPLDFSTADALPDENTGCVSDHHELIIFGRESTEAWQNTGAAGFPFERGQGGIISKGCLAPGSICLVDGRVMWLGNDKAIYALAGYTPERVSPPWIDKLIASSSGSSTARSFSYTQLGHTFYVLGMTDLTICYDQTTRRWHTRKSRDVARWSMRHHASCYGVELVGGDDGNVYKLDTSAYSDAGTEIERVVIPPPISAGANRAVMSAAFLDMDPGVGLETGQGSSPLVALDWSHDGGKTWSNKRYASPGAIGEYHNRLQWARLGEFRQRSLRFTITDPVKVAISGAYAQIEARE